MTFTQIECFLEAARQGSFTKAGIELYISQQSLSRQVQALEKEMGIQLFNRQRHGIELTHVGQRFFEIWSEMMERHQELLKNIYEEKTLDHKTLKIGITDMGHFLSEITDGIMTYNENHKELDIEYEVNAPKDLLKRLEDGSLHMLITYRSELEKHPDLKCLKINKEPLKIGIYMSKKNPLAAKRNLRLEELGGYPWGFLGKEVSNDHKDQLTKIAKENEVYEKIEWKEYSSRQNLALACVTEKCIAIVFKKLLEGMEDKLVFFPLEEYTNMYDVAVVWKDDQYASYARTFALEFHI